MGDRVKGEPTGELFDEGLVVDGKYRLDALLGRDPLVLTFRATDAIAGREVVLRVLRPELHVEAALVDGFMRDALAALRVRHPHLVDLIDVSLTEAGTPYVVSELLHGETLAEHSRRKGGRMAPLAAVERMLPVVRAVAYAHDSHLVHGRLGSSTIFLALEGTVLVPKVLGLATPMRRAGGPADDARSDVWALGATLYELVAGRSPWPPDGEGDGDGTLREELAGRAHPALEELVPDVHPELARIVGKCLSADAASRYPTAGGLAVDLSGLALSLGMELGGGPRSSVATSVTSLPPGTLEQMRASRQREADARAGTAIVVADASAPPTDDDAGVAPGGGAQSARPRAPRSRWHAVAPVAVVCVLAGASWLVWHATHGVPAGPPAAAHVAPVAKVVLAIDGRTRGAVATVRGHQYPLPVFVELDASRVPEMVRVEAPGFVGRGRYVTLSRPTRIDMTLDPRVAPVEWAELEPQPGAGPHHAHHDATALASPDTPPPGPATDVPAPTDGDATPTGAPAATAEEPTTPTQPAVAPPTTPSVPTPPVAAPPVRTTHVLSLDQVQGVVGEHRTELAACIDAAGAQHPADDGTLRVTIGVAPNGRVSSARATGAGGSESLAHCIEGAITRWTFPATDPGATAPIAYWGFGI